jgi:hypothetical protein
MASLPPAPDAAMLCPACGTVASGKFCSNCAAPLAGATCGACAAPLTPGAKYCHRCGTPAGADVPAQVRNLSTVLPWSLAGIAFLALIAMVAAQRFSGSATDEPPSPPSAQQVAPGGSRAPDISNLTPGEAAIRLYDRVMGQHERGQADSVQLFAPMAITAYQQLGQLDLDQRYDLGRIAAVSGDESLARAEADSILAQHPNHLLGLILAGNAARMRKDSAAERTFHEKFVAAVPAERAKQLPEYSTHENDITIALEAKRP